MESKATLWIVGTPLTDTQPLAPSTIARMETVDFYIGETRKVALRLLSKVPGAKLKPLYLLDESSRPEEKAWEAPLRAAANTAGVVALFSDTGMPLLFDPGVYVLEAARKLGMKIRSISAATSWGSACALSGWEPPFFVAGFPPRDKLPREAFWRSLRQMRAHCVLMERPYRFLQLLSECRQVFGKERLAFLAWELDSDSERLQWGSLSELERAASSGPKTKGEFVLVIQGE